MGCLNAPARQPAWPRQQRSEPEPSAIPPRSCRPGCRAERALARSLSSRARSSAVAPISEPPPGVRETDIGREITSGMHLDRQSASAFCVLIAAVALCLAPTALARTLATDAGGTVGVATPSLGRTSFERVVALGSARIEYQSSAIRARRFGLDDAVSAVGPLGHDPAAVRRATGKLALRIKAEVRQRRRLGGLPAAAFTERAVLGVPRSTLDAIADCESGGDPTAANPAGYYGKYQFNQGTWAAVGGSGNPAEATEDEQDYRAAQLYRRSGAAPWPVCGL